MSNNDDTCFRLPRWRMMHTLLCMLLSYGSATSPMLAAGKVEIPFNQKVPPGPAKTPAEAQAAFTAPAGFTVHLAASEPDLINPVAMAWDDRGRLFVAESVQYPHVNPRPGRDRVRILEDTDNDGVFDRAKTFAEGLNIPSGIEVGYGGVFVTNSPEILFLRDIDGDDVADERTVILNGFGQNDRHELPNSLTWGPDGWLYGFNGVFNPSRIVHEGSVYDFTCALFRYHPLTKAFELYCEGTSNPWGLDYNRAGHWFVSACVVDHLWHFTQTGYYERQAGAYPPHAWKIESIVDHNHQMRAYCGLAIYDADVYPEEFRGNVFMGNIHGNCINRDKLSRNGATYLAQAEPDFISANDAWFMPVSVKLGPDGCLWVLDWYDRYHCYQDALRDPDGLDRGRGRLWRVTHGDVPMPPRFDLQRKSNDDLLALLSHPNSWWRRKAQRILTERRADETVEPLKQIARADSVNNGAMQAVWTLLSMRRIDPTFHAWLIEHENPAFRAWALRAASEAGSVDSALFHRLQALASDASPDVLIESTIASRRIEHTDRLTLLVDVLKSTEDDPLLPHIAWENLHPEAEEHARFLATWFVEHPLDRLPIAAKVAERFVDLVLPRGGRDPHAFKILLKGSTGRDSHAALLGWCVGGLWEAARSGELSREQLVALGVDQLEHGSTALNMQVRALRAASGDTTASDECRRILIDRGQEESARLTALHAMALSGTKVAGTFFEPLLAEQDRSTAFKRELLGAMGTMAARDAAALIINRWDSLPSDLRPIAMDLLAGRVEWAAQVLAAIEAGDLNPSALNANHVRKMNNLKNEVLSADVARVWGKVRDERNPEREKLVTETFNRYKSGVNGDAAAGQAVYKAQCAQCHKIYGFGYDVGPDLTGNGRSDLHQILSNLLDPNLVIGAGYTPMTVWTLDDEIINGILVEDSAERIVLKIAGGEQVVILKRDIDEVRESQISLMPEELEKGMTEQQLRDLTAFLLTTQPPLEWEAVPDINAGLTTEGTANTEKE